MSAAGEELTLPEGTVYPALHRLEAAGLLRSSWAEQAGRRRRLYELTARGASVLELLRGEWRRFSTGSRRSSEGRREPRPIEGYLDQLLTHLRGSAHDVRRILSETEEHLRDAAAELLGRSFGAGFVAGDLPGMTYTSQRCAEFLEYFPNAGGCEQAAALHHWGEVVEYRVAVGVVGAFVLGAFLLWRRRPDRQDPRYLGVLPDGFSATVAASLHGVAAAALALLSLDSFLVAEGDGTGQWLSAAIVAAAMAPTDS